MKIVNKVLVSVLESDIVDGKFVNKTVVEVADECFFNLPSLRAVSLPKVKKIGSDCFRYNQALTEVNLPALTTAGSDCFSYNQALTEVNLPALTTAGSDCFRSNQALTEVNLPALTTAGSDCFRSNQALTEVNLPALTTAGSYCFSYNQALTSISIKRARHLPVKDVDGFCFIVFSEKTSKGIKIYSGANLNSIEDGWPIKEDAYVAEKDGFYAHGETVKKAISDLQFKIVAEKLKNEPILPETVITINHYRLITGACEMGVKSWMEDTFTEKERINVTENGILASKLLPILKRKNAYGLERFKSLVTF